MISPCETNGNFLMTSLMRYAVKPGLSGHSKIDKMKVLKKGGSLMQVESIVECSLLEHSAILLTCIKQLPVLKTYFLSSFRVVAKDMFDCYKK